MILGGWYEAGFELMGFGEGKVNCLEDEKWRATTRGWTAWAVNMTEEFDHSTGLWKHINRHEGIWSQKLTDEAAQWEDKSPTIQKTSFRSLCFWRVSLQTAALYKVANITWAIIMTSTLSREDTKISIQIFADAVLVLVTQVGKVGNLVHIPFPSFSAVWSKQRYKPLCQLRFHCNLLRLQTLSIQMLWHCLHLRLRSNLHHCLDTRHLNTLKHYTISTPHRSPP